jgi:hypothetical protein
LKLTKLRSLLLLVILPVSSFCQLTADGVSISFFAGGINYQGDLNPNSFTLSHARLLAAVTAKIKINKYVSWRLGVAAGKIQAADRYNREYLQPRNLSFYTSIKEINTGAEIALTDETVRKFIPYLYGGFAVFHFNPWTRDIQGNKIYLQPLSTEGQGIAQYPDRKPYKLTQLAFAFGAGAKYAVSDFVNIGVEFSQRKTFTDYLDDVSSSFVDEQVLLDARGPKAVELAFRGDELPGNAAYPRAGEQRGTPTEKDWYYFLGITFEIKLSGIKNAINGFGNPLHGNYNTRCPRRF